jgi:hypothetical protein
VWGVSKERYSRVIRIKFDYNNEASLSFLSFGLVDLWLLNI